MEVMTESNLTSELPDQQSPPQCSIYFDFDSYSVDPQDPAIQSVVSDLKSNPAQKIQLQGNTDPADRRSTTSRSAPGAPRPSRTRCE